MRHIRLPPGRDPRIRPFIRLLLTEQSGPPRLSFYRMIRSEPFRELCGYYHQPLDPCSLVRFRHAARLLEKTFEPAARHPSTDSQHTL